MSLPGTITVNMGLNFYQQLFITMISVGFSAASSIVLFYVTFKTDLMFELMERMTSVLGKNKHYSDYSCNCTRCQFTLRTKKGMKQWKRDHRYKKEELI